MQSMASSPRVSFIVSFAPFCSSCQETDPSFLQNHYHVPLLTCVLSKIHLSRRTRNQPKKRQAIAVSISLSLSLSLWCQFKYKDPAWRTRSFRKIKSHIFFPPNSSFPFFPCNCCILNSFSIISFWNLLGLTTHQHLLISVCPFSYITITTAKYSANGIESEWTNWGESIDNWSMIVKAVSQGLNLVERRQSIAESPWWILLLSSDIEKLNNNNYNRSVCLQLSLHRQDWEDIISYGNTTTADDDEFETTASRVLSILSWAVWAERKKVSATML